jgi:hypothetical protein
MIQNDRELHVTLERIAAFQRQLEHLRHVETIPANYQASAAAFLLVAPFPSSAGWRVFFLIVGAAALAWEAWHGARPFALAGIPRQSCKRLFSCLSCFHLKFPRRLSITCIVLFCSVVSPRPPFALGRGY